MTALPAWWTSADAAHCAAFARWQAGDGSNIRDLTFGCRTCWFWSSADGARGDCTMPATPATVNCGATQAHQCCEQWTPRAES
jgi:hypothetical protein